MCAYQRRWMGKPAGPAVLTVFIPGLILSVQCQRRRRFLLREEAAR